MVRLKGHREKSERLGEIPNSTFGPLMSEPFQVLLAIGIDGPRERHYSTSWAMVLKKLHDDRKAQSHEHVFERDRKSWKSWRTAFEKALERAKIQDFRFHDLRHCYGSNLGMANTNSKAMIELMGHKTEKMTMRYTHLSMEYKQ